MYRWLIQYITLSQLTFYADSRVSKILIFTKNVIKTIQNVVKLNEYYVKKKLLEIKKK